MATQIWANTNSGSVLFPEVTTPFPESISLMANGILWHLPDTNFTESIQGINW